MRPGSRQITMRGLLVLTVDRVRRLATVGLGLKRTLAAFQTTRHRVSRDLITAHVVNGIVEDDLIT